MILAIRNKEGTFDTTPSASDGMRAGDTLIVLGTREQISRLEQLMGARSRPRLPRPFPPQKHAVGSVPFAVRIGG